MSAGQDKTFRVEGWNIGGSADTWDISTLETGDAATTANFNIVAGSSSLALPSSGRGSFAVTLEATQIMVPGSYEGSVVLVSRRPACGCTSPSGCACCRRWTGTSC